MFPLLHQDVQRLCIYKKHLCIPQAVTKRPSCHQFYRWGYCVRSQRRGAPRCGPLGVTHARSRQQLLRSTAQVPLPADLGQARPLLLQVTSHLCPQLFVLSVRVELLGGHSASAFLLHSQWGGPCLHRTPG